ncbi:MAG: hypothetical protein IJU39_04815 [Clostridia bacterium]|nr:hypothetical protein [Clostridia bacterium]
MRRQRLLHHARIEEGIIINIDKLFKQFGLSVRLCGPNNYSSEYYKCFIQPLRYKNKMYLDGVNTAIGFNSEGHYLYIGPARHDLTSIQSSDFRIAFGSEKFKIDRAEKVYFGDSVLYVWAIIRKIVEVSE